MQYTSAQKAAAALVAIGKPQASALLKLLSKEEISRLHAASKTMSAVTQNVLTNIVDEFEHAFTEGTGLLDSSEQINSMLSESFSPEELAFLDESKSTASIPVKRSAWEILNESEDGKIREFLLQENPQVSAYVLSRLPPDRAGQICRGFDRQTRAEVLSRIMKAGVPSKDVEILVEGEISTYFSSISGENVSHALGKAATILNELDRDAAEEILADLSDSVGNDQLSAVRGLLFRFEDVAKLGSTARTRVFDGLPADQLTLALRGAEPEIAESVLSSISQRSRRMIESDLKSGVSPRPADVLAARRKIVSLVMRLSSDGQIDLPKIELAAA